MRGKFHIARGDRKIRVGVVFGGRSPEHEVSLVSAASVINALDRKIFDVIPIGISPEGKWYSSSDILECMKSGKSLKRKPERILLPDPSMRCLAEKGNCSGKARCPSIDVVIPVLHGTFGEDGSIQGLLELADIPYVGAGVSASSLGMDKILTKELCERKGITTSPYLWFAKSEYAKKRNSIILKIEDALGYPCFIKPANSGSSVGISKARNRAQLVDAVGLALKYDRRVLAEKCIPDAREIEVGVLGNGEPIASVPGEIISSNEFYDYDAKYIDGKTESVIPAKLSRRVERTIKMLAVEGFRAIDCAGMARVDFLLAGRTGEVYLSEINTIPGFTSISMFPKLWEASGIPYPELLYRLIWLAFDRFNEKEKLARYFSPPQKWYR